jgi:hypothetical protein
MAWTDDIQAVKYTSPLGNEFTWFYDSVSLSVEKKTSEFKFAERDGVFVQDLGRAGRSFPFTLYFVGENYHTESDRFLLALEERGIGKLEHPLYGVRDVVPTGTITRNDNLVTESNQAVFSVTFSETIKDIFFPSSEIDATENINASLDNLQDTAALKFSADIVASVVGDKIKLATRMSKQLQKFNQQVKSLIAFSDDIKAQFDTIKTSYENAITGVFDNAETIARQGIQLVRLPAKVNADIKLKTQIFNDCFTEIVKDFEMAISKNNFFEVNKNLMSYNSAICESVLFYNFRTRNEAVETAESVLLMFDDLKDFQDEYLKELGIIDTGEDFEALSNLISFVTGYLISQSFSLPSKKIIILGEERNIIELCSELYGNLEQLDYFIETNDFNIDELEVIPINREVIYYE